MSESTVCAEFTDLAAALALDAIADEDEARRIEAHAAACPDCGRSLTEFREAAALLGGAVPQVDPPAVLRTRVLAAARAEAAARRSTLQRLRAFRPRLPRLAPAPAWAAVALSVIISLGSLTWAASLQSQISQLQAQAAADRDRAARYDRLVQVFGSDRLAVRPLTPVAQAASARGVVYMDPISGAGMLMCRNMPPIEPGHAWQVWFVRGNERVSGGMLWPNRQGNGYTLISVPPDLQSFDSIGLTDEPGNGGQGSSWPTTPRVMATTLNDTNSQ